MKQSRINRINFALRPVALVVMMHSSLVGGQELLPEVNVETLAPVIQRLKEVGRKALQTGDRESAIRAFEELLRIKPESTEALYQLAIASFQNGDYVRGFELINKAVSISPGNPFPRLALAKALGEVGQVNEAIEQYEFILQISDPASNPADTALLEMNLLKLRQAARRRDQESVLKIGRALMKRYSTRPSLMEIVANVYAKSGLFEEAKEIYEVLLDYKPKNPTIEFQLGGMYEMMREPELAMEHYERAVRKGDGTGVARAAEVKLKILRGFEQLQKGDKEQAFILFQEVLEIDENNIVANMNVAGFLHEKRDLNAAKSIYQRVVKVQPGNLDAQFRLAIVYLDLGDAVNGVRHLDLILAQAPNTPAGQSARQALARASQRWDLAALRQVLADERVLAARLKEAPNDAEALSEMGKVMMRQRRFDEAIKYFEQATAADSGYGDGYFNVGLLYEQTQDYEKAVDAYEAALALVSDDQQLAAIWERLRISKANFHMGKNEYALAEENFLEANQMKPGDPAILWGLAAANAQQGDLEEAVQWYQEVIEVAPNNIGARMNAAFIYEQLEEEEKAEAHYKAIVFSEGAPPDVSQRAEERLDYIRRQTNGFSYVVGYSMAFDDNLNSAQENKYYEYRSDVFAGLTYKYKLKKGMKLSLYASPAYSIYHRSQFDFFNFTITPSLLLKKWGADWDLGISRNSQSSVLRPEQSSSVTETLNSGVNWLTEDKIGYRASLNYRGFGSSQNPFFDANLVTLGINRNHAGPDNTFFGYGYTLTVNENKNTLGNDYAYIGHGVNGRIDKRFDELLTGYIDGNVALNIYTNPDSSTNFQRFRRTVSFGVGAGVNYRFDSWVSFYASYRFSTQYSNLPIGFIFNELQSIEGRQSTSLGSFVRNTINAGVRMNF